MPFHPHRLPQLDWEEVGAEREALIQAMIEAVRTRMTTANIGAPALGITQTELDNWLRAGQYSTSMLVWLAVALRAHIQISFVAKEDQIS